MKPTILNSDPAPTRRLRGGLGSSLVLAGAAVTLVLASCTAPQKSEVAPPGPVNSQGEPLAAYVPHWPGMQGRGLP